MDKILLALAAMQADMKNFFAAKPAADDSALKAVQAELAKALAERDNKQALLTDRETSIAQLEKDLAAARNDTTSANASISELTSKLSAETKRVEETLAALGIDPKQIPAAPAPPSSAKTLTRAEFEALPFAERNAFIRAGGKLK